MNFDFQRYIQERRTAGGGSDSNEAGTAYGFSRDRKVMKTLQSARFVNVALKGTLTLESKLSETGLLDGAERVDETQHPALSRALREAATQLSVTEWPLFITSTTGGEAIVPFGIKENPRLLITPWTPALFNEVELNFIFGRGLGHIASGHTPLLSTAFALDKKRGAFASWVVKPAQMGIAAWRRHANVTADRAGLLAAGSVQDAVCAIVKTSLMEKLAVNDALERVSGLNTVDTISRVVEDNLQLSRRILALRAFTRTQLFRQSIGKEGGESLSNIDREVESIVKIW